MPNMHKFAAVYVVVAAAAVPFVIATPASAAIISCGGAGTDLRGSLQRNDDASQQFQRFTIISNLKRKGIPVQDVDEYNGCIQAFVRTKSGGTQMQFFDPNTYRRIYTDNDKHR